MEPVIPVNVKEEMLSDASEMALNLSVSSFENLHNTLTRDEAVAALSRLSDENRQLKGNLEQANLAMKSAFDMITKLKENDVKKQKEIDLRRTQAKEKIEALRQAVADRDKTLDELRTVQASAGDSQLANSVAQANQSVLQHRQKMDQLRQELAMERNQKSKLLFQQEMTNKQMAQLNAELKTAQLKADRCVDHMPMIENLRSHVQGLEKALKAEKDKSTVQQEELSQLRSRHDQLLSDYHDLLVESDRKAEKGDVAVLKKDYDQRLDCLTAQLMASEDVLISRDNQIQALQQRVKDFDGLKNQLVLQQQEIEALQAQANVYKADFEAERKSREELNDQRLQLQEKLIAVEDELEALKVVNQVAELQVRHGPASARHSAVMVEERSAGDVRQQQRIIAQEHSASQGAAALAAVAAAPAGTVVNVENPPTNRTATETTVFLDTELKCPMCNHVAPDIDSLQLHCNDCIQ